MSLVDPPIYSEPPTPLPIPDYSSSPLEGEETVLFTPRGSSPSAAPENITKTCSFLTLILKDQSTTAGFPTYGTGSTVYGEIGLKSSASVLSVEVKLKGRLYTSISGSGSGTITVVAERVLLWSQDSTCCPSVLPFAIRFPRTFTHDGCTRPIPPSFTQSFVAEQYYPPPPVSVRCSYWFKVTIHHGGRKMAFWKPSRSYSLQLNYLPRSRPQRPISHLDSFLTTFKHIPEDWLQIESIMRVRAGKVDVNPVSCRFFIPSVGAFGLSDSIPFHIQLSSSLASLRLLLPNENSESKRSRLIRVFITRQTMVEAHTRKCWKSVTLGEGTLRPVAPPADAPFTSDAGEVNVDWEGEVCYEKKVLHGGFNIGTVIVKDYIVFALLPPNPRTCPLLEHQSYHPIRLVTSVWTEENTLHPSELGRAA